MNKLLTPDEVADLLKVKKSTIYSWTHLEYIPHIKLGNRLRFKEADIRAWRRHVGDGGYMLFHDYKHRNLPNLTGIVDEAMADWEYIDEARYLVAFRNPERYVPRH